MSAALGRWFAGLALAASCAAVAPACVSVEGVSVEPVEVAECATDADCGAGRSCTDGACRSCGESCPCTEAEAATIAFSCEAPPEGCAGCLERDRVAELACELSEAQQRCAVCKPGDCQGRCGRTSDGCGKVIDCGACAPERHLSWRLDTLATDQLRGAMYETYTDRSAHTYFNPGGFCVEPVPARAGSTPTEEFALYGQSDFRETFQACIRRQLGRFAFSPELVPGERTLVESLADRRPNEVQQVTVSRDGLRLVASAASPEGIPFIGLWSRSRTDAGFLGPDTLFVERLGEETSFANPALFGEQGELMLLGSERAGDSERMLRAYAWDGARYAEVPGVALAAFDGDIRVGDTLEIDGARRTVTTAYLLNPSVSCDGTHLLYLRAIQTDAERDYHLPYAVEISPTNPPTFGTARPIAGLPVESPLEERIWMLAEAPDCSRLYVADTSIASCPDETFAGFASQNLEVYVPAE